MAARSIESRSAPGPPGHERRARRRALDLDVVVVEADALVRHFVDARRGCRAAVDAPVTPADVVHKDKNDVWA